LIIFVVVIVAAYLYLQQNPGALSLTGGISTIGVGGASIGSASFASIGANSDPSSWYEGIQPGTVTVGGQAAPPGWTPSTAAKTGLSIAGAGIGAAVGIASTVAAAEGTTSVLAASTALGAATLGIGLAVGLAATVLGMLSAHHQQALAAEGRALNDADARMVNAMALVMQAVLAGAITSTAAAQQALQQIVADWYGEVKTVQKGTWHYTGQDLSADYQKVWIQRTQPPKGAPGFSDYHAPDPCNGACVIGHFFAERNSFLVMAAVSDALAGNHGQLMLPEIPAHDTQSGSPEVTVTY
jgi:hypothetical protein